MFTTPLATAVSVVLLIAVIYLIVKKLFKILVFLLLIGLAYYAYQKYIVKHQTNTAVQFQDDIINTPSINNSFI